MYSQRHIDRQDIHAVGGVEGDLSNRLADDGCKVRIIGIEAQFGAMPDVGHMMQAVLTAIGGGQHYAVDLVGLVVQIKTGELHLVIGVVTIGFQLHGDPLYGGLGGVDFAELPLAAQQVVPCGDIAGRGLTELVVSVALVLKQGICAGVGGGRFLALQGNGNVVAVGIGDLLVTHLYLSFEKTVSFT